MQDTPQDTAAEAPAPDAEAAAVETPQEAAPQPNLEEQLRQAQAKAQEHHDGWLRAKAEVENIRKRAQDDVTKAHRYALDSFSEALLPVRDSLEASLAAPNLTIDSLKTGVELTLKQLAAVFEKFGIAEIDPLGEKFDPHRHQAIATVESDAPANTVVQVLQKGYRLHDRIVRPALVTVAKAREG
ncbi:MAG TPA: nucleotide exchange factor GrpE [Burkholderiales bacterium]|nr:nucleotide exchange factor GrpE [Burkholderiales bacterium]